MRTLALLFAVQVLTASSANATLIQRLITFNANDDSVVSGTQTISYTALGGQVSFDLDLTITGTAAGGGATDVIDTSYLSPAGNSTGLSLSAGNPLAEDEAITFSGSISNINTDADGNGLNVQVGEFSFAFIGLQGDQAINAPVSTGTLNLPSGDATWVDGNGPAASFFGHIPGVRSFTDGDGGVFAVSTGFNIPDSNASAGGSSVPPVTTFSHTAGVPSATWGGYTLNNLVVQVRATPEPGSIVLGLMIVALAGWKFGWRRLLSAETTAS